MHFKLIIIFSLIFLLLGIGFFSTQFIVLNRYKIDTPKLKLSKPFRVLHLTDYHNAVFFPDNTRLIGQIKYTRPDIILITGDIIDRRNPKEEIVFEFLDTLLEIAPVYFVTGNHEYAYSESETFIQKLKETPIHFLDNQMDTIEIEGQKLRIIGISDYLKRSIYDTAQTYKDYVNSINIPQDQVFSILLVHRPHYFRIFADFGFDLVVSGHTHGGHIALPFIGAIYVPDQGFFPSYVTDMKEIADSKLIINDGLGNGIIPFRFLVNPEIVLIEIE